MNHELDISSALFSAPVFKGLPSVELAKLVSAVEVREYKPGEVLVAPGEKADGLLVISEGTADLMALGASNEPSAVISLGPGETFGEVMLGGATSAGAGLTARTSVRALLLPQARYRQLAAAYPDFGRRLSATLAERLQARNRTIADLGGTVRTLVEARLQPIGADERRLLGLATLAEYLPSSVQKRLGGSGLQLALRSLAESPALVLWDGTTARLSTALREYLRDELLRCEGLDQLRAAHLEIARGMEDEGDVPSAAHHFAAAEQWDELSSLRERAGHSITERDARPLLATLSAAPASALESNPALAQWRAELQQGQAPSAPKKSGLFALSVRHRWGLGLAIALFALIALPAPPPGLSREGQLALALLAASVPLMVFDVIADHLVAVFLVVGWAAMGLVPGRVALSGYSSSTWFVVLAILGIGVGIGKTGLLYRAVLSLATRAPRNLVAQALTLAMAGLFFTPAMPNATSRMALSAPVGLEMIDAFGLARRGPSSVIVGMATLLGFGLMGTLFLTGTSSGLLVHSVLPNEVQAQFSFLPWFLGALPLHLTIFVITMAGTIWLFRDGANVAVSHRLLQAQSVALGKPSRGELISGVVMAALILGLVTEPWHKINAAWIAGVGLLILGGLNVVDANSFRNGINWSFVIFFGAITSLGDVFSTLKVDIWLGEAMSGMLAPLAGAPALFLLGLAVAGLAMCFAVRWQAASVLLTLVMSPPAAAIGISPFVVGMVALTATNLWVFPYQSTIYLALYSGVDGRLFSHEQIRPIAVIYAVSILVGVLVSVPWWKAMGLMP